MKTRFYNKFILLFLLVVAACTADKKDTTASNALSVANTSLPVATYADAVQSDTQQMTILSVCKEFKATQQDSLCLMRAQLNVPQGSLLCNKELSITAINHNQMAPLPTGMVNVTSGADGFRFLPHGEHFVKNAATIVLPFDSLKIPQGYTANDIHTYYYDEKHQRWQALEKDTIDAKRQLAYSRTEHFTDMINGILKVPESPETGTLTPTFISDYKPVNPASGITQIKAPVPNEQGTAVLNYPLTLPAARGQVTPNLMLQYSSDGGSSYVGYGFSIPMETITIDTRWGCPSFDKQYESESYLLNGQQFTEKAHYHTYRKRQERQSNKQFYLRVDSQFLSIVRKGNSPTNYTWQVVTKDGIKKTYTGFDGIADELSSQSTPTKNNQVVWVLTEVEDKNGNTCTYTYKNFNGNLYPKTIVYTGHKQQNLKGAYQVVFQYSAEKKDFDFIRLDKTSSYRLGIEQTDAVVLSDIQVYNQERLLKGYAFKYKTGAFGKTNLVKITETDSKAEAFYSHTFDYFEDTFTPLYESSQQWDIAKPLYKKGSFFTSKDEFTDECSMINGSRSSGYNVGGGLHAGFGITDAFKIYAGTSYTYSHNENEGKVSLTDLDGDGLPDLIFMDGDTICYRKNIYHQKVAESEDQATSNTYFFSEPIKLQCQLKSFSIGESETHNLLVDAGVQILFISGNACYSHNWQNNYTKVYLHDFNANGLIDIANDGCVYFNHINAQGIPTFTTSSQPTPCPIPGLMVPIDSAFIPNTEAIADSLSSLFPRHDVVKLWRAPYDGTVSIRANVQVDKESKDGIRLSIQYKNNLLYTDSIAKGGRTNIDKATRVQAGEKIYFRLQSNFSGLNDSIHFDAAIKYISLKQDIDEDENGTLKEYVAADEFLFCGAPDMPLTKKGNIRIQAPFSKEVTSDDICLIVRKTVVTNFQQVQNDANTSPILAQTDIEKRYLKASNVHNNEPMDIYLKVDEQDIHSGAYLSFIVESNSQIKWENIKWRPVATYIEEPQPFMYIAPTLTMYNKHVKRAKSQKLAAQSSNLQVDFSATNLEKKSINPNKVHFSLKDKDGKVYYSGPVSLLPATIRIPKANNFYGTFHVKEEVLSVSIANYSLNGNTYDAAVYSCYDQNHLGHLYRGWGQFAYNGENEPSALIDETKLGINAQDYEDAIEGIDTNFDYESYKSDQLSSIPTANSQWFYAMQFSAKDERYNSIAKDSYVAGSSMSSSRIGRQDIYVPVPNFPLPGTEENPSDKTACPHMKSSGQGDGFTGSVAVIASVGGGWSNTTSYNDQSLLDINSDGYPDWISRTDNSIEITYTNARGQLTDKKVTFDFTPSKSNSTSSNLTTGVSFSSNTPDLVAKVGNKNSTQVKLQQDGANANSTSSIGISGNYASNEVISESEWIDYNGDGLPDIIYKDGDNQYFVRYNVAGESFTSPVMLTNQDFSIYQEKSSTHGAGMGVNIPICGKASAGGGIGMNYSDSHNKATFRDMNADGLVDYVYSDQDGNTKVRFNVGGILQSAQKVATNSIIASRSTSYSYSCNVAGTIPAGPVLITPSATYADTDAISKSTHSVMDLDGDGFPDLVNSYTADKLSIQRSTIGKVGKLKTITLPLKGKINLDYAPNLRSYRNATSRYCLSTIETTGGAAELGATSFKDTILYSGGHYNRCERTFFGFDTVSVSNLDTQNKNVVYRTTQHVYATNSIYTKGLVLKTCLLDSSKQMLSSTEYTYLLKGDSLKDESVFPALVKSTQTIYQDQEALSSTRTYDYDSIGNTTSYAIDGELTATVSYHAHDVVKNMPQSIEVSGGGIILQKRNSVIDKEGNITQYTVQVDEATEAVYDITYDVFGNVVTFTRPENNQAERVTVKVKYDDIMQLYPIEISDSYGFTSSTQYHELFCLPTKQTDINGSSVSYTYDSKGRLTSLRAPKEEALNKDYTLQFEYHLQDGIYQGITRHNTPQGECLVYAYVDSLGREKYTENLSFLYKDGVIEPKMVRSPYTQYDAFMRKVAEIKASISENNGNNEVEIFALHSYDELDRPVQSTFIDGAETTMQYCIAAEPHTGKTTLQCTTTDAEGRKSNTYTDALGRNIATESYVNGEAIRVVNTYDALSRITEVLHPNGHMSTYKYDMLGNVVESQTPDAGTVKLAYTPQGAIASRTTATGEIITYNYSFERLQSVSYSYHPNDSVVYTYGDSLSADNEKGRLLCVRYPMGSEKYTYGNMGEVIETVKSIVIDSTFNKVHTYTTKAEYDSWNRLESMTYPDGEVVNYEYYPSGQLQSITGTKDDRLYPYLIEAGYHVNGQTAFRKLGNNSEHRYFYDHKDRLQMTTLHVNGQKISENSYSYDKVDNITTINGNNNYYQRYTYDELNRLVRATGNDFSVVAEQPCSYNLTIQYNNMSSPVLFTQMVATETATTSVNNTYHYDASVQPNAPKQIGEMRYTYDAAGNPTSILNSEGKGKDLRWDAENRLRSISDSQEGLHHAYAYDHTGERILKRYGSAQQASYNGKDVGTLFDFGESYSAYVSPYFVETNNGYTKHYYAGATRLVSKIGEGVYKDSAYVSYGDEEKDQYFYFQDHLGSSTYITTLNGEVAQYAAYTPYGELFREYRNVTPYKFNGKELDAETGLYYYGARYYNPATALWLGVDPLASKYPRVSPYVYCHSNPINRIDPDGRDDYDLNEKGYVVARRENKDADTFRFVDKNGETINDNILSFEYGTVEGYRTQKVKGGTMDVYKIRGDKNAKQLYEFMVEGTASKKIEWSWFETGIEGDKGLNFVSTSHMRGNDASAMRLYTSQLKNGYTVRTHTHNHPSGILIPSGEDLSNYAYIKDMCDYNKTYSTNFYIYAKEKYNKVNIE